MPIRERAAEIEEAIVAWTSGLHDYQAMALLQGAGVPSGPSLDFCRVYEDAELVEGGFLQPVETDDGDCCRRYPGGSSTAPLRGSAPHRDWDSTTSTFSRSYWGFLRTRSAA